MTGTTRRVPATKTESARATLLARNERLSAVVVTQVGTDLEDEHVGPAFMKRL